MNKSGKRAFTLVELMVVVAIIAVLLALLSPALDNSVYAAQLAQCGANLKAIGSGAITYAFENKKYYPDRGLANLMSQANYQFTFLAPNFLADRTYGQIDCRPQLKAVMSINKQLIDPLCQKVDLEND